MVHSTLKENYSKWKEKTVCFGASKRSDSWSAFICAAKIDNNINNDDNNKNGIPHHGDCKSFCRNS